MKKGFTLVELLAVLVILGVLALIAFPSINALLQKSKMGTFRDGALGIMNAVKQTYVEYAGREMVVHMSDDTIILDGEKTSKKISYKGTKPEGGYVMVSPKGLVSLAIYDATFCAYKREEDDDISVKNINDPSECTLDSITD